MSSYEVIKSIDKFGVKWYTLSILNFDVYAWVMQQPLSSRKVIDMFSWSGATVEVNEQLFTFFLLKWTPSS